MKWKSRLSELGLTEETISHGLRKKIKDYYKIQATIDELNQAIQEGDLTEEQKDSYRGDAEDLKQDLANFDKSLVADIEKFDKNKDRYAEMAKTLKNQKNKSAEPKAQVQVNAAKEAEKKAEPVKDEQPQAQPQEAAKEEKKKSGFGWIAFALLAGVVTLGAVNIMRNRD